MSVEQENLSPAEVLTGQPELFRPGEIDQRFVTRAVEYAHTGKSLLDDPEDLAAIVECLSRGMSVRAVARRFGRSRETIRRAVDALAAAGKLEPLEKRTSKLMGSIIESSLEVLQERVDRDEIPSNVLPVLVGILSDKKAVLDGRPVAIQESRSVVTIEALNAAIARLPAVQPVIDVREISGSSDRVSDGNDQNV